LDPDSITFVDPDSESGSMGKKNEEKNALFLKGIVSPDWKGLQMVSLDTSRFEV
jgi:hypothetical protein